MKLFYFFAAHKLFLFRLWFVISYYFKINMHVLRYGLPNAHEHACCTRSRCATLITIKALAFS